MNYDIAWLVIVAAGLLGSAFLFLLTRGIGSPGLRWMVRVLPLMLMVVPAPVPGYAGQLAPAFVVLIFESLFQRAGAPGTAAGILLATALIGLALGLILGRVVGTGRDGAPDPAREKPNPDSAKPA